MANNRSKWLSEMRAEFPDLPECVFTTALDVYDRNPDFFKKNNKKKGKKEAKAKVPEFPESSTLNTVKIMYPDGKEYVPQANECSISYNNVITDKKSDAYTLIF